MKIYYWKNKPNFGDLLAPLLIRRFCHLDSEWADPLNAELVMVGSVIEHLPMNWKGVIAGAGILHEKTIYKTTYPILAVRGPLTYDRIINSVRFGKHVVFADPGLLADELVGYQDKKYDLGLVPHWTDKTLENNPIFKKYNPKIINVADDPLEVIRQIGQCKKIVSSSLHGIILADAFGIPRRIEMSPRVLSHPEQEGGLFKWKDYSASIGMRLEIGLTQEVNRNIINDKQNELFDVFEELKSIYSKNDPQEA